MWAIRQKSTGWFIPAFRTGQRRGGTHQEPTADAIPRLFRHEAHAKIALSQWLKGKLEVVHHLPSGPDWALDGDESWEWTTVPDRDPNDMEIIEVVVLPL